MEITIAGRTRKEWIDHIDQLISLSSGGSIPVEALLYGWPGVVTTEDIVWAKSVLPPRGEA